MNLQPIAVMLEFVRPTRTRRRLRRPKEKGPPGDGPYFKKPLGTASSTYLTPSRSDGFHLDFIVLLLHGVYGGQLWPLILLGKIWHSEVAEMPVLQSFNLLFSLVFKVVGEVGLEPTKA